MWSAYYLFRPPITMRRSGQNLDSAMAVEPPTLPVPPIIRILEFFTFSGSSTLSNFALFFPSPVVAIVIARFPLMPAQFNCRQNLAIVWLPEKSETLVFVSLFSPLLLYIVYQFIVTDDVDFAERSVTWPNAHAIMIWVGLAIGSCNIGPPKFCWAHWSINKTNK